MYGKTRVDREGKEGAKKSFGADAREIECSVATMARYVKLQGMPTIVKTSFTVYVRR